MNLQRVTAIEFHSGSKEELLQGFTQEFPYIASCSEFSQYSRFSVPWHWHKSVELFYIKQGILEYCTPKGKIAFPAGSGGLINSNVLHTTKQLTTEDTIQYLHIFDSSFISGKHGSLIEQKYVTPLTTDSHLEMIPLFPEHPDHIDTLNLIRDSFHLSEQESGYEIKLRNILSEIWLRIFGLSCSSQIKAESSDKANNKIKSMMVYIHEHFAEKITISELANASFSRERECFRVFHDCLHMTPMEYLKSYRIQMACQMLSDSDVSVTTISQACGLGSSSYLGKIFREYVGCTPLEYRRNYKKHISTDK